jgi:hypothetical protein
MMPSATRLIALTVFLCAVAGCAEPGGETATADADTRVAAPSSGTPATSAVQATGEATAPAQVAQVVEAHAKGVFFDRRPLQAQVRDLAAASKPTAQDLRSATIVDAGGFGQPMTAMTLDVPAGWKAQGGIEWEQSVECPWNGPRMQWSAASSDGLFGIAVLPEMGWQVASRPIDPFDPCPSAPMASVREYLEFVARTARPGARVLAYRDRPELVAAVNQAQQQQPVSPLGAITHHAGELLVGYSLQGHEMRETLVTGVTLTPLAGGALAINSQVTLAVRAPDGLLDFAFAERVRSSLRFDQQWTAQRAQWSMAKWQQARARASASIAAWHNKRMNEITLAGMTARHRIRMDTIADLGRINSQIAANTSATNDRIHERTLDAVMEVQPWRDPSSGQQVDLSIHYENAWQLSDGRQFLTNDRDFDPGRDLGISGHRLEPVR